MRLPGSVKLRGLTTKAVLRARARRISCPAEILDRRKMGFPVPVGRWLRGRVLAARGGVRAGAAGAARGLFDPAVAARPRRGRIARGARDHGDRLWLLLNLEIWQRVFLEGEGVDAVLPAA